MTHTWQRGRDRNPDRNCPRGQLEPDGCIRTERATGDSSGQPEGSAALAACSAAGGHLVDSDGTSRRDRALHGPAPLHQLRSEHNFNVEGCGKFWPRAPPRKATARTATRMTARPSCTARGPTGNGVPAAERRWGSFKLVTGQAWRGHLRIGRRLELNGAGRSPRRSPS